METTKPFFPKFLTILLSFVSFFAMSADYYWVGGTGNWSDHNNHWATTSGGSTFHNQVPTESDNVYFDANSFTSSGQTLVLDADAYCFNMDWSAVTNNPTFTGSREIHVFGSMELSTNMNYISTATVYFDALNTGMTINTGGQTLQEVYFTGQNTDNGGWILQSDMTIKERLDFYAGTLITNGYDIECDRFYAWYNTNKTINFTGSDEIKVGREWRLYPNLSNTNFNPGTSTIILDDDELNPWEQITFIGGGFTYYNVIIDRPSDDVSQWYRTQGGYIDYSNTFNHVTFNIGGERQFYVSSSNTFNTVTANFVGQDGTLGTPQLRFNSTITAQKLQTLANTNLTGEVRFNSNSDCDTIELAPGTDLVLSHWSTHNVDELLANGNCERRISLRTMDLNGSPATLTKTTGTVNASWLNIYGVSAAGGATFNATNSVAVGTVSGWNISMPSANTYYWVGGSGNWNDVNHWSTTSGGSPTSCGVPTLVDNVVFDGNSFSGSGQTVTMNVNGYCNNIDWSAVTNNPTFSLAQSLTVGGSLTFSIGMNVSNVGWINFVSQTANTIDLAGHLIGGSEFSSAGNLNGEWTLLSDFDVDDEILFFGGTFISNGHDLSALNFRANQTQPKDLDFTGTQYIDVHEFWDFQSYQATLEMDTATIRLISDPSYVWRNMYFYGGSATYHNVYVDHNGPSSYQVYVNGSNTINDLEVHLNHTQRIRIYGDNTINNFRIYNENGSPSSNEPVTYLHNQNTINKLETFNAGNYSPEIYFYSSNTIGELTPGPGNVLYLGSGQVQTVTTLNLIGSCDRNLEVASTNAGSAGTFNMSSGTVNAQYIKLQDNIATGGATFNATSAIDNGNVSGWNITTKPAANYYWVGGSGQWNDPAHWSTSSGGSGGTCDIPSFQDNVFFDVNSFTSSGGVVSVTSNAECRSMTWNGVQGNPSLLSSSSLNMSIYGSLIFDNNVNVNSFYGNWYFESTQTGNIIDTKNKRLYRVYFNGSNTGTGEWDLQSDLQVSNDFYHYWGTINTNGYDVDCFSYWGSNGNLKELNLNGAGTFTAEYYWQMTNHQNTTFNAGNYKIIMDRIYDSRFSGGNRTYYDLEISKTANFYNGNTYTTYIWDNNTFNNLTLNMSNPQPLVIEGNNTFNDAQFNFTNNNSAGNPEVILNGQNTFNDFSSSSTGSYGPYFTFNQNNTFSSLTCAGVGTRLFMGAGKTQTTTNALALGSGGFPVFLQSTNTGTQANIYQASGEVCLDFVWLKDMNATGGASFNAGGSSSDLGNNTGWSFTSCDAYYWVGGTGNWSDTAHWATSSGGSTKHLTPPTQYDDVFFDGNSFNGPNQVVNLDVANPECNNMSWLSSLYNPTLDGTAWGVDIHGSMNMIAAMDVDYDGGFYFMSTNTGELINSGGNQLSSIYLTGTGEWSLTNTLSTDSIYLTSGSLLTNDRDIQTSYFIIENGSTKELDLTTSTVTITDGAWDVMGTTGLTFIAGTSEIIVTSDNGTSDFSGGGLTYNNALFTTPTYMTSVVEGLNTFNNLRFEAGVSATLPIGNQTTSNLEIEGSCTKYVNINSETAGSQGGFYQASGVVDGSFVNLTDNNASGGATFNANLSVNNGNVSGWNFTSNATLSISLTVNDASCANGNDGSASVTVNAGTPPFNYSWSTTETTNAISGLIPGSYAVTVIDSNGCDAIDSFNIAVPPAVSLSASGTDESCNGAADGTVSLTTSGGTAPFTFSSTPSTNLSAGTYQYYVTDSNGCSDSATVVINSGGSCNAAPVASCNSGTFYVQNGCTASISAQDINAGSYDPDNDPITYTISPTGPFAVGTHTVSLIATDPSNLSDTCTASITVADSTSPSVITQDVTVHLDNNGNASINASQIDNGSSDNCGIASMLLSNDQFGCVSNNALEFDGTTDYVIVPHSSTLNPTSELTVEAWVRTNDASQNQKIVGKCFNGGASNGFSLGIGYGSAFAEYYTTNGNQVQSASGITSNTWTHLAMTWKTNGQKRLYVNGVLVGSGAATAYDLGTNTNNMHIGIAPYNLVEYRFDGDIDEVRVWNVERTPSEIASNMNSCLSGSESGLLAYYKFDQNSGTTLLDQTSNGNDGSLVNMNPNTAWVDGTPNVDCTSQQVTLTVTDNNGNTSNATAQVTVIDTIVPVVVTQNITVSLDSTGNASISSSQIDNGSTDNCTIDSVYLDIYDFDCSDVGTNTVTLTIVDNSGNSASSTALVTVENNIYPIASAQNLTVQLDSTGNATITAAQIDNGSSDNCGIDSIYLDNYSFDCSNVGVNTVTLSVVGSSGNVSTDTATITVQDIQLPEIAIPFYPATAQEIANQFPGIADGDYTLYLGGDPQKPFKAYCADMSSSPKEYITLVNTGGSTNRSQYAAGGVASGSTVNTNWYKVRFDPTTLKVNISDYTYSSSTGSVSHENTTKVPYGVARGCAGQVANGSGNVNLVGTSWTTNDNWTLSGSFQGAGSATKSSNDQIVNFSGGGYCGWMKPSGSAWPVGGGFVLDLAYFGPTYGTTLSINGLADITQATDSAICGAAVTWTEPQLLDNCAGGVLTSTHTPGDTFSLGTTTVVYTATDASNNVVTDSFTVTITDQTAPVAIAQNVTVQLDSNGNGSTTALAINNGSDDACGVDSIYIDQTDFDCSEVGANTVTLTVIDNNGNSSSTTSTVTVEDNIAPVALTNDLTVYLDVAGNASITTQQVDNGSNDACGIDTTYLDNYDFNCSEVGLKTVTLTVIDVNGNTSTATSTITVVDSITPATMAQNLVVQLDSNGQGSITAQQIDNMSNDACGVDTIYLDQYDFDCSEVGANTVTLTVIDVNGNVDSVTATVTVEDNIAPEITSCVNDITTTNLPGNCFQNVTFAAPTFNDACGFASIVESNDGNAYIYPLGNGMMAGSFSVGVTSVTYTATDNNGNASICSFTVEVIDNEDPYLYGCPNQITVFNAPGQCDQVVTWTPPTASDNCPNWMMYTTHNSGETFPVGITTVTYDLMDPAGNSVSCSFNVEVLDVEAPAVVCQNITIQLDASGMAMINPGQIDNGSTDNCGIDNMALSQDVFTCANVGQNTVTLIVTDIHGNVAQCNATVTVEDNVAPLAISQNLTIQLDSNGQASITASQIDNGSSDACGIASLEIDSANFDCSEVGANTVVLTVTDNNGNVSTASAVVTVEDNIAPSMLTQNVTVYLDANGAASITAQDIDNGSSDNCGIASLAIDSSNFDCSEVGANTVTITATDVNGNVSTATATVTVVDTINPTVLIQNITVQLDSAGAASITTNDINNGSFDNCGIASLSLDITSFDCSDVGANTVTLTAMDVNGNSNSATAVVTVEDNVAPVAIAQNLTVQLDANGQASITANQVDNGSSDACGIASLAIDSANFDCSEVGANTVTLTVTDNNGNVSTASAVVTVEDNIAPSMLTQNVTVYLDANGAASITEQDIDNGSSDNCGIASLAIDSSNFDCSEVGANTVTLTATDVNGNVSSATATVTVVDTINPTVLTQNITVQLDSAGAASITTNDINNGSFDNCGIASLSLDITSFDCSDVGTNTVTLTATDVNGNSNSATAVVTVEDNVAPVAIAQNLTVQLDANGQASITANQVDNGSNDACGIASLAIDSANFDCSEVGANAVTLTVTDNNGNVSTATATVTVEDNTAPSMLTQNITVQLDANGAASITAQDIDNGTSDNCGIASLAIDSSNFDCSNVGANTVTLTATDVNGNVSSATSTVTVEDNVAPVAMAQNLTVQLDANGQASITANQIDNGSNDACGIANLDVSPASFDCSNVGTNTVTLTVTDNNGNVSTAAATVTVEDNTLPTVVCTSATVTISNSGVGTLTASMIDGGSSDNCGIASMTVSKTSFDCSEVGTHSVTLIVTDNNGNTDSCVTTVQVVDPTLTLNMSCNDDITVSCNDSQSPVNWEVPSATTVSQICGVSCGSGDEIPGFHYMGEFEGKRYYRSLSQHFTWTQAKAAANAAGGKLATVSSHSENQFIRDNIGCDYVWIGYNDEETEGSFVWASGESSSYTNWQPGDPNDLGSGGLWHPQGADYVVLRGSHGRWYDRNPDERNEFVMEVECNNSSISITQIAGPAVGSVFPLGVTTVSYVALDSASGLTDTCTFDVTVEADITAPMVACKDITITLANPIMSITPNDIIDGTSDDCSGVASISISQSQFDSTDIGVNIVTVTVTDGAGNVSTCESKVTVEALEIPQYCPVDGNSYYEWIHKVKVGNQSHTSGNDGGYGDHTDETFNLSINSGNFMKLYPGYNSGCYTEYWRVWIDLNGDGDFNDGGEKRFQRKGKWMRKGWMHIPNWVTPGTVTTMRVAMSYNGWPDACGSVGYGEVEDYTVVLTGSSSKTEAIAIVEEPQQEETIDQRDVVLYPNPNDGLFKLSLSGGFAGELEAEIWSIDGKLVDKKRFARIGDGDILDLDMRGNTAGIYFIKLRQEGFEKNIRFTKF